MSAEGAGLRAALAALVGVFSVAPLGRHTGPGLLTASEARWVSVLGLADMLLLPFAAGAYALLKDGSLESYRRARRFARARRARTDAEASGLVLIAGRVLRRRGAIKRAPFSMAEGVWARTTLAPGGFQRKSGSPFWIADDTGVRTLVSIHRIVLVEDTGEPCAYSGREELPGPIGADLEAYADATNVPQATDWFRATTELIAPGDMLWIVGSLRQASPSVSRGAYRDVSATAARIVGKGGLADELLIVKAKTFDEASALLTKGARRFMIGVVLAMISLGIVVSTAWLLLGG
ncbi:MAG: hypothetical protein ABI193_19325 [Minicystis sp.]